MNWLALVAAMVKLLNAIAATIHEWKLLAAGEARGRAARDAEHARAAAEVAQRMQSIADRPPTRAEIEKRLEEGGA